MKSKSLHNLFQKTPTRKLLPLPFLNILRLCKIRNFESLSYLSTPIQIEKSFIHLEV